jgi:hypothetical protein
MGNGAHIKRPLLAASVLTLLCGAAAAQVVEADLRTGVFLEPSSNSELLVLTPGAALGVAVSEALRLNAGYEADIVSGASESVKGGPLTSVDVVSSATSFSDVRHVFSGGFQITRDDTELGAAYSYGVENDYRSNAISVSAGTTFLRNNTEILLSYGRGFDQVCTSAFVSTLSPTARTALDSSDGCFTSQDDRATRDIAIDTVQIGWTQTWTPVLATQLVFTGSTQHGFLGNPYREVVIGPAGDRALEHHPENRARAAAALRLKYFARSIDTAFGLGVRGYRDTWDVLSQTVDVEAEHYLLSWLRLLVRGRFYNQTGALFWSDDYTGGEPRFGPRGQYWSGDRELSPLQSYLVGGRLLAFGDGSRERRVAGVFTSVSAAAGADALKTNLEDFTWGGQDPDDTLAIIGTLSVSAAF